MRGRGGWGTGKTTAVVERYLALIGGGANPSNVAVICRTRPGASRFRDAVMPRLHGGFDSLAITTFHGVAFDALARAGHSTRLLTGSDQWAIVAYMLTSEGAADWPTLHEFVGRRAFVDEVARAVLARDDGPPGPERPSERANGPERPSERANVAKGPRSSELHAFLTRYRAKLATLGAVDSPGLLEEGRRAIEANGARFEHVLVDDFEAATAPMAHLVRTIGSSAGSLAVTGNPDAPTVATGGGSPVHLESLATTTDVAFVETTREQPSLPHLITCRHPSIEPEAIAAEVITAHRGGTAWSDIAILVRQPAHRGRAIGRALSRNGIPVSAPVALGRASDEPIVRGLVDLFRWVEGDERAFDAVLQSPLSGLASSAVRALLREAEGAGVGAVDLPASQPLVALRDELRARRATATPADLATIAFRLTLSHLVTDPDEGPADPINDRALDTIVAFVNGLAAFADRQPGARLADYLAALDGPDFEADPWRLAPSTSSDGVTVSSISAAAGRAWPFVIVAGCVEGELPRVTPHPHFFDTARPERPSERTGPAGIEAVARRRASLDEEERLFSLACSRATGQLIATAGPEPGVLPSRYVEGWTARPAAIGFAGVPAGSTPLAPTPGVVPIWRDQHLVLSASQLATWADCPRKYGYSYALRTRGDGNLWAEFGTLVHEILRKFLDPEVGGERTKERLWQVAEELWGDGIGRYRPQREEARRDLFDLLEGWWTAEGEGPLAPRVVAVERAFDIEVGSHRVVGSIDRIDRAADGVSIEVVDYKTGRKAVTAEEAVVDLQLATYHLAATRDPQLAAMGPATRLRLLFLRDMQEREQPIRPDHAASTETMITETAAAILTEDFTPSVTGDCRLCDYRRLCPLQPEGREVG